MKDNIVATDTPTTLKEELENFESILKKYVLPYKKNGYYFFVGSMPTPEDKVIYVSVVRSQVLSLIKNLVPILAMNQLSFQMVTDQIVAHLVADGTLGYENLGKIITIFIPSDMKFKTIVDDLITLTNHYKGPAIPNCIHIGGCAYQERREEAPVSKLPKTYGHKYVILKTIKNDAKGNVYKALQLKSTLKLQSVIIKEGLRYMISDESGKDMMDRLHWQREIHDSLYGIVNVPKIFDCFESNGNSYLAMEFIQGEKLQDVIQDLYQGRCWKLLGREEQDKLIEILLKILDIIKGLHDAGYVHRDLTPANFIVTPSRKLYIIDLELAYSIKLKYPEPAFEAGTIGYMSPEQRNVSIPTLKEDIFGLGAILSFLFTNIPPIKFALNDSTQLQHSLTFFTENKALSECLTKCLNPDPQQRPSLEIIIDMMKKLKGMDKKPVLKEKIQQKRSEIAYDVENLLLASFRGLILPDRITGNSLFQVRGKYDERIGRRISITQTSSLMTPINGLLVLRSLSNFVPSEVEHIISKILEENIEKLLCVDQNTLAGLLNGTAGQALAISYGILRTSPKSFKHHDFLSTYFSRQVTNLDLANGLSGQLLALTLIYKDTKDIAIKNKTHELVTKILKAQRPDGSWQGLFTGGNGRNHRTNLCYGSSGVIISLITFFSVFPTSDVQYSILKGLKNLDSKIKVNKRKSSSSIKYCEEDHSLIYGTSGTALTFIHAYRQFKIPEYKSIAENILFRFNPYPIMINYSLAVGLSGLGIVYNEAFTTFGTQEWSDRAQWIYEVLAHSKQRVSSSGITWNMNGLDEYDVGLMTGTSVIILFLEMFYSNLLLKN